MLRGLWELTWLETKIFVREPLGFIGSVGLPVAVFIFFGRMFGGASRQASSRMSALVGTQLPVLAVMLICLSAVMSLVTIIAIYREGGILKRLRATPLRPHTILTAHVLVKIHTSLLTMALLFLAGKRYYPGGLDVSLVSATLALLISTVAILSMGFVIASVVPTARFAQPIGTLILYPMIALCGLFAPISALPSGLRVVARVLPLTYVASLLQGIWRGDAWSAHTTDLAALAATFVICTALSARVFRWE
jgi:ABC-2 type transport system permease protein